MFNGDGGMFFGGGFMWIFWILIIVAVVVLFKNTMGGNPNDNNMHNDSPLEILKKRYARGEINEEEYERRRKELES